MLGKCSLQHCHSPPFRGRHYCQAKLLGVLAKLNQDQTLLATKLDQLQVAHLFSKKNTHLGRLRMPLEVVPKPDPVWKPIAAQHPDKNWKSKTHRISWNILQIRTSIEFHWGLPLLLLPFLWQGACQQTPPKNFVEVQMIRWFADSPKYRTQYTQYAQKQSENILLLCHDSLVRVCSDKGVIHFLGRNQVHDWQANDQVRSTRIFLVRLATEAATRNKKNSVCIASIGRKNSFGCPTKSQPIFAKAKNPHELSPRI